MSVRVMNKGAVEGSVYVHGMSCISMIESPEMWTGDRKFSVQEKVVAKEKREENKVMTTCSSSSTSSIGKNSDLSSGKSVENSGDTDEVQSPYKGPLDAMEALEGVLPMRRGISRFYNGKSKSFASLADASSSSSSIKDLAKPENAYMRRRRNLLAYNLSFDKNSKNSLLKSNGGGVSKRATSTNRTTALALAVTMSSSDSGSNQTNICIEKTLSPDLRTSIAAASPLVGSRLNPQSSSPRHEFPAWRSYSLADLQHCMPMPVTAATTLDVKPSQT